MVETTLPRMRSASLEKMPRYPFSTEARISFAGTSFGAIAKYWVDTDAFHFSLTKTDADTEIFALFKLQLRGSAVLFSSYKSLKQLE